VESLPYRNPVIVGSTPACAAKFHYRRIKMERVIAEALDNIDRITDLTNDEKAKIIADELKRVLANQLIEQLSYL
tara:strand:+ start:507 stop:731 length:225 start_codon:yes stop_codon:yes gene_type:complete